MNTVKIDAARYREQGFLVLQSVFSKEAINSIASAAQQIVEEFEVDAHHSVFSTSDKDRGRDDYFMESGEAVHCFLEAGAVDKNGRLIRPKSQAINKIGHALHDRVPAFRAFCRQRIFAQVLYALGHEELLLWQTMYIFKQPHIGGEVRWHQDASYLITTPPAVTGFWIAVEDARRDNGCLWVQPGGHRSPLREIYEVDPATRLGELRLLDPTSWPGTGDGIALEVPAGSMVVFHDHMPHFSAQNRSPNTRQSLTLHFAPTNTEWSPKNWLQRPNLPPFTV